MFGLGDSKKKKGEEFVLDLEKEARDPEKGRELERKVEKRIQ